MGSTSTSRRRPRTTTRCLNIPAAGCYSLKGDQALAFVRSRHYEYYQNGYWHFEAESDLARIQRQQAFIKKMIKKAEGEFTNPLALNDIIGGVTKNLTVDSGFSPSLMLSLAKDFRSMDVAAIPNLTLPTYGYTTPAAPTSWACSSPGGPDDRRLQRLRRRRAQARRPTPRAPPPPPADTVPRSRWPPPVNIEVANGTGTAGQAGQMTPGAAPASGYHAGRDRLPRVTATPRPRSATPRTRCTAAKQVAAQIPGGATLVPASDSDADGLQPRGDHRLQLHRHLRRTSRPPSASTSGCERHHGRRPAPPPRPCPGTNDR